MSKGILILKRPHWVQLGEWTVGGNRGCGEPCLAAVVKTGVGQVVKIG